MTARGTNRQLLQHIGVEIPEGAVSFYTERERPQTHTIVFSVNRFENGVMQGSTAAKQELTDKQAEWLFQQGRSGSFGWQLDDQ